MTTELTSNKEDYIKAIYKRQMSGGEAHISDIASDMGLRKASVCRSTDILKEKGFLQKDKYRSLALTPKGLEYAGFLEERYSVTVKLLHELLGVDLKTANEDACGMEHAISMETYGAIRNLLRERLKAE